MDDIEERPSKIQKLDLGEHDENLQKMAAEPLGTSEKDELEADGEDKHNSSPNPESHGTAEGGAIMSKNQLKKLRRQEKWLAQKDYRKTRRREKNRERQARKVAAAEEAARNGVEISKTPQANDEKPRPRRPIQVPVSLILDCDFNDLMTDKELISLGAQLTRSYSDNRTSHYRSHMAMSSWGGKLKTRFETVLANHHLNWKGVRFVEADFEEAAKELDSIMRSPQGGKQVGALSEAKEQAPEEKTGVDEEADEEAGSKKASVTEPRKPDADEPGVKSSDPETDPASAQSEDVKTSQETSASSIVYLTSDSPHILDRLSPNTSYIIGGIVDKNRHKGICYKRATERGIPTAKLPIGEYMTMQSRSVLAVNHVVEIMLKWLETGDWGEAFLSVIPKRKEAKLKTKDDDGMEDNKSEDGEEDAGSENEGDGDDQEPEGVLEETAVPTS